MPHSIVNIETKNSLEPGFATRFSRLAGFFNLGNLLILKTCAERWLLSVAEVSRTAHFTFQKNPSCNIFQ